MDEMFAIKCQNCGGPMYSHQAKRSFECAYCGTVIPWQADAGEPKSALGIRHTPLTVVDGLLKLTHVSQLERPEDRTGISLIRIGAISRFWNICCGRTAARLRSFKRPRT